MTAAADRAESYANQGRKILLADRKVEFGEILMLALASGWAIARELAELNETIRAKGLAE